MLKKIGVQLFTIRDYMSDANQMRESFRKLRELGYDEAQTAGSGGVSYVEMAEIAKETGLEIVGTHYGFDMMIDNFEQTLIDHRALGTTNAGIGGYWGRTASEIAELVEKANKVADKLYENGMKFTYHNHSHEFMKVDGDKTIMDLLVEGLDPEKTSFVLDTYWVQHGGADVRYWIEKLAGRIDILHLKDMGRQDNGEKPQFITEIGNGNLYWKGILETAEKSGVKYYCVEQDTCPGDPFESLKISSEYLHKNFM